MLTASVLSGCGKGKDQDRGFSQAGKKGSTSEADADSEKDSNKKGGNLKVMSDKSLEQLAKCDYQGKISIMHDSTSEESQGNGASDGFRSAIAKWEEDNPNITLNQTVLANEDFKSQIVTLAAAGDLPDIFLLQGMNTKTWAEQGLILDLTDYVKDSPFYEQYNQAYFTPFTDQDKIYGVPTLTGTTCTVILYDKRAWKAAGFDEFPKTWEEVEEANKYFKEKNLLETFAFGNKDMWQANSCFFSTIADRFTGPAWFQSMIDKGGAKFTDTDFINALTFTQDIFSSGIFNDDFNSINNEEAREYYISGEAPAFIGGDWDVSYLQATLKEADPDLYENTGFAALPQPKGATKAENTQNIGLGYSLGLNAKLKDDPEKLAAAVNFILYATGPDYAQFVGEYYALQGLTKVDNIDLSQFDQYIRDYYDYTYVNTTPSEIYDSYISGAVWDAFNSDLQIMLNGDLTPREVADNIQKTYEKNY